MNATEFFVDGTSVRLGNRIGRGGEGDVFRLADQGRRALKVYTDGKSAEREAKISAMVRRQLASSANLVAFPLALARDNKGRFVGFTMNLVEQHQPLHELYAPGARKQNFPRASYPFLVRAAQNIARAVASVHQSGCVIGDVNHSGILISNDATAALIDADSFQFIDGGSKFLCRVGVPEYTPPELQGKNLSGVERSPDHDAFGLSVVIFQILAMGRHPFVGTFEKGEMALHRAIAEHRFAYSQTRRVGMTPPPGACTLDDFPPPVTLAFERTFSPHGRGCRTGAAEWVVLLHGFEKSLRPCAQNALHHYSMQQNGCPWCRMEGRLGMVLFLPTFEVDPRTIPSFESSDLSTLWGQVEAIKIPARSSLKPYIPTLTATPSNQAQSANPTRFKFIPFALYVIAGIVIFAAPAAWLIGLCLAGFGYFLSKQGTGFEAELLQRRKVLEQKWDQALDAWGARCKIGDIEQLKSDLLEAKLAYADLPRTEQTKIAQYQAERRSHQLVRYLERFRIAKYKIKGIGPAKLALLASYGIETAAEIISADVLAVPGFGHVNSASLFAWRAQFERQFVYNQQPDALDQREINRIRSETLQEAASLRAQLTNGARELWQAAKRCENMVSSPDPELVQLAQQMRQLEVDAQCVGVTLPTLRTAPDFSRIAPPPSACVRSKRSQPARQTPAPSPTVATMMGQPSCPSCGRSMVMRVARRGYRRGQPFWGCAGYPNCRGTRPI